MKKLFLLGKSFLLISIFVLSGCIKNEETDGVKSLRQAQANYIQAEADRIAALIDSEVAYNLADAAFRQAEVDIKNADARKKEAQTEQEIAILQAETTSKVERANIEAQAALNISKKNLEASLRALKEEVAKTEAATPALDEYLTKYAESVGNIADLQDDIIDLQEDINLLNLELVFEGPSQALLNSLARNKKKLQVAEDKLAQFVAANNDPNSIYGDANQAIAALLTIEEEIEKLSGEMDILMGQLDVKDDELSDIENEYNDFSFEVETLDLFRTELTFSYFIDDIFVSIITGEPGASGRNFLSIPKYDEIIADGAIPQEDRDEAAADKAIVEGYIQYMEETFDVTPAKVEALRVAYFDKIDEIFTMSLEFFALDEQMDQLHYDKYLAELVADALEGDYERLVDAISDLEDDIATLQAAVDADQEDVDEINNVDVKFIEDKIAALSADLANLKQLLTIEQKAANLYLGEINNILGS